MNELAVPSTPGTQPQVWLVFPPLVETNFGSFYPSSAVLAAFLLEHGIPTAQDDLNEEFALHLLDRDLLAQIGKGQVPGAPVDTLAATAARWLSRSQARLFDAEGRHQFGMKSELGYLVEAIARPFLIDPNKEILYGIDQTTHPAPTYMTFYKQARLAGRIPSAVTLVGITVAMGAQLLPTLLLAAYLKSLRPALQIVLGGPAISLMDEDDLSCLLRHHRAVDCAVKFDGEYPLLELARQAIAGMWNPDAVPGASYLNQEDGETVHHNPPAPGPDVNTLPAPRYPQAALARLADPELGIIQARGCYWGKCDYCDFVELYGGSRPFRTRRPDNFVNEIEHMVKTLDVRKFNFVTESIPPAFARRVSHLLLERGLAVTWNSFAMVDRRFDRELLALMVKAGCEFLVIGLETTITRVLKHVHKSSDREENFRFLRDAHDVGMRLRVNLIPDLPSTTYAEALQALADIESLADCVEGVAIFPFEATRSSRVGRDPQKFGLIPVADLRMSGQAQYALNHFDNVDPAMTPLERSEIHRLYRAFADRVAVGSKIHRLPRGSSYSLTISSFFDEVKSEQLLEGNHLVRIPVEDLDLLEQEDHTLCTHIRTRERISIPAGAHHLLKEEFSGVPFSVRALRRRVGAGRAKRLIQNLLDAQMLTPVDLKETSRVSI